MQSLANCVSHHLCHPDLDNCVCISSSLSCGAVCGAAGAFTGCFAVAKSYSAFFLGLTVGAVAGGATGASAVATYVACCYKGSNEPYTVEYLRQPPLETRAVTNQPYKSGGRDYKAHSTLHYPVQHSFYAGSYGDHGGGCYDGGHSGGHGGCFDGGGSGGGGEC